MNSLMLGFMFMLIGVALIKLRHRAASKAAILYKKIGIDVPEQLYTKQFYFIGVLFIIFGFLAGTGLTKFI